MNDFIQYALFGLATGSLLALLGCGIILTYQGSGTVNFAHSALAVLGGYTSYELHTNHGVSIGFAVAAGALVPAVIGVLFHFVVLTRLRSAGALVRIVATLALLTIVQQGLAIRYGNSARTTGAPLPEQAVRLGSVAVGRQSFYLLAIACVVVVVVQILSRRSTYGLAVTAASQNQRAAAALGWAPDRLAAVTWALGGALAGLAGALAPAVSQNSISVNTLGVTIIPALATALLARFRSYPLALVGGLGIGIIQSEAVRFIHVTGVGDAVPFLAIVLVLVVRGTALPVRGFVLDRLPSIGTGKLRLPVVIGFLALVIYFASTLSADGNAALTSSVVFAIIGLSVVVVTGYAGQLSLAQFALAGVGAWVAGRLVGFDGWPFSLALLVAVLGTAVGGLIIGLPALRTRGVNLAVVTLGLGFAVQSLVFLSPSLSTSPASSGINVPSPSFLGIHLDPYVNATAYSVFCGVCLILTLVIVCNLRRSRAGRRLLAVRGNERAAAALGINVFGAKLFAFALSAGIAALGGVLLAFTSSSIEYSTLFDPFESILVVALVVIGGVGYSIGPVLGSLLAVGGVGIFIADQFTTRFDEYLQLGGGIILLFLLLTSPNGVAAFGSTIAKRVPWPTRPHFRTGPVPAGGGAVNGRSRNVRHTGEPSEPSTVEPGSGRVVGRTLEVRALSKNFGGVLAFSDIDLVVRPGEVVGLLGPNGAGKTSLVDAVTGFITATSGTVLLDGVDIGRRSVHRRSRLGVVRSFQSLELFDDLTVRENLLVACDARDSRAYLTSLVWPGRPRLGPFVTDVLGTLGLRDVLDVRLTDLSYGQRRLVALSRAVAGAPSVLLLDEPGAGLDQNETAELGDLVRSLATTRGMGVLLIEHDVEMVMRVCDRVVVLDAGRKIADGPPEDVRNDPAVIAAYLGVTAVRTE